MRTTTAALWMRLTIAYKNDPSAVTRRYQDIVTASDLALMSINIDFEIVQQNFFKFLPNLIFIAPKLS